jgi:hypothetical protein
MSNILLKQLIGYVDWGDLSENKYMVFKDDLLIEFEEYWDWTKLSKNRSIHWSKPLVEKYKNKIDWDALSNNTNVDWVAAIVISDKVSLNWELLSMNRSFDITLAERYKNYLVWTPLRKSHGSFFDFNKQGDPYYEYAGNLKINIGPSLSANTNFRWSEDIISRFYQKLDFWIIALRGQLTTEIVIKYAAFFDEIRLLETNYRKHSDWGTYDVYTFHNGWQNLAINPNFQPDGTFYTFAEQRKVREISTIDTFEDAQGEKVEDIIMNHGTWVTVASNFKCCRLKLDYSNL